MLLESNAYRNLGRLVRGSALGQAKGGAVVAGLVDDVLRRGRGQGEAAGREAGDHAEDALHGERWKQAKLINSLGTCKEEEKRMK